MSLFRFDINCYELNVNMGVSYIQSISFYSISQQGTSLVVLTYMLLIHFCGDGIKMQRYYYLNIVCLSILKLASCKHFPNSEWCFLHFFHQRNEIFDNSNAAKDNAPFSLLLASSTLPSSPLTLSFMFT